MGILQILHPPGKVAGIDVAQSSITADGSGAQQILGTRIGGRNHFVVLVKRSDVPGDIGRHIAQKGGQVPQFVVAVVEAGNEQGYDLQPQTHLVQTADGVEDRLQASAELVIVAIVEALEVHFVEIDPRMEILQDLRRPVAVRNKRCQQTRLSGLAENRNRPLAGDQRLVIGADHNFCALGKRVFDQQVRIGLERRRDGIRVAQRLRSNPVLAIRAVEIAAQHSETVG